MSQKKIYIYMIWTFFIRKSFVNHKVNSLNVENRKIIYLMLFQNVIITLIIKTKTFNNQNYLSAKCS